MPLRAVINGREIIAPFLDETEWDNLSQRVKSENLEATIPCCGNPAYLRTSKQGVNHFVHKVRGNCTSVPETWQHLKAKQEILLACRDAGYDTSTEVVGDSWRADVLAIKGNIRIAFEVQWSPQPWDVTQERQQRYKDSGIRSCWLFKSPPEDYRASRDVPLFKLEVVEDACTVIFHPQNYHDMQAKENQRIELRSFISSLLSGKIRFCEHITAKPQQELKIKFINRPCWSCGALYDVYRVVSDLESNCGETLTYYLYLYNPDSDLNFAFHPEIQEAVRQYVAENAEYDLAKFTRYRRKDGTVLDAFQCPHCDAFLGHKYLMETYYSKNVINTEAVTIPVHFTNPPSILEDDDYFGSLQGHWCFSENGNFCC